MNQESDFILIAGIPGSGTSVYSTHLRDCHGYRHVEADAEMSQPGNEMTFHAEESTSIFELLHEDRPMANLAVQITGGGHEKSRDGHVACFLEVSRDKSAFMSGNFLAAPRPALKMKLPSSIYHTQMVLYEKYWMQHGF